MTIKFSFGRLFVGLVKHDDGTWHKSAHWSTRRYRPAPRPVGPVRASCDQVEVRETIAEIEEKIMAVHANSSQAQAREHGPWSRTVILHRLSDSAPLVFDILLLGYDQEYQQ